MRHPLARLEIVSPQRQRLVSSAPAVLHEQLAGQASRMHVQATKEKLLGKTCILHAIPLLLCNWRHIQFLKLPQHKSTVKQAHGLNIKQTHVCWSALQECLMFSTHMRYTVNRSQDLLHAGNDATCPY